MRRMAIPLALALAGVPALGPVAQACGDKLLMVGRGVKFGRVYASVYPGNVLLYARQSAGPQAAVRDAQLHKNVRQAGHALSVIEDAALLEQALRSVAVDVIVADVGEAALIERLAAAAPSRPTTLYVLGRSLGKDETRRLQQQYACPLKASDGVPRYLDVIENTMKARATGRRASS